MANLRIDITEVNSALASLQGQLMRLEVVDNKLRDGLGHGWESINADKVNEKLGAFHESVGKIRISIGSIKSAVSQYKTNVTEVDTNSVKLNTDDNQ